MRHAYLIITHGNFEILEKLLRFLDSENADFFIHLDAKVRQFDFAGFSAIPKHSKVTYVDRFSISWGHFSMVEAELALLRASVPGHYDYYHLLSGVDVPIKSRAYIENYFTIHNGTNFLCFEAPSISQSHMDRVRYYYPLQGKSIRNRDLRYAVRVLQSAVQKVLFIDRTRKYGKDYLFQKGTQWFSITHALSSYLLDHEKEIRDMFRCTCCPDELFVHTMAIHSPYRDTFPPCAFDPEQEHRGCCRWIDWHRGKPYIFTEEDFSLLTSLDGDYLFARKFDFKTDPVIVDRLFSYYSE